MNCFEDPRRFRVSDGYFHGSQVHQHVVCAQEVSTQEKVLSTNVVSYDYEVGLQSMSAKLKAYILDNANGGDVLAISSEEFNVIW